MDQELDVSNIGTEISDVVSLTDQVQNGKSVTLPLFSQKMPEIEDCSSISSDTGCSFVTETVPEVKDNATHHEIGKRNHPIASKLPVKKTNRQIYRFNEAWYKHYPWLTWNASVEGFLCDECYHANKLGMMNLAKNAEPAFIKNGFSNWKKGKETFEKHQASSSHLFAVRSLEAQKQRSISSYLSDTEDAKQKERRRCLFIIVKKIRFLLRQGLSFRSNPASEGNLYQLLVDEAEDDPEFGFYLKNHTNYASWSAQQEFSRDFSLTILRKIAQKVAAHGQYGISMDSTQDAAGEEQVTFILRHVDDDLVVHEDFIGLYSVDSTTGAQLAEIAKDVLKRLNLNISMARAQTYDGAANMAGKHNGCGTILKKDNPLLLHFHCQAHAANLVVQAAAESSELVRKSISIDHELAKLSKDSIKIRQYLKQECSDLQFSESSDAAAVTALRPLCPTRWLCRFGPIKATVDNYPALVSGMRKIVQDKVPSTATGQAKAEGILRILLKVETYLGLCAIIKPLALMEQLYPTCCPLVRFSHIGSIEDAARDGPCAHGKEQLSLTLQAKEVDLDSTEEAVKIVNNAIKQSRNSHFEDCYKLIGGITSKVPGMKDLKLPRQRLINVTSADEDPVEKHYRIQFYQFIDRISAEILDRFSIGSSTSDLGKYRDLCKAFKTGEVSAELKKYPELDFIPLKIQMKAFRDESGTSSLHDAARAYREMSSAARNQFPQVFTLMKILLVCPVSAATCERSFSALRRVKTWLRNTLNQERLNHNLVCLIHRSMIRDLSLVDILNEFTSRNERRKQLFGINKF